MDKTELIENLVDVSENAVEKVNLKEVSIKSSRSDLNSKSSSTSSDKKAQHSFFQHDLKHGDDAHEGYQYHLLQHAKTLFNIDQPFMDQAD